MCANRPELVVSEITITVVSSMTSVWGLFVLRVG